jgi:hypothetical protein
MNSSFSGSVRDFELLFLAKMRPEGDSYDHMPLMPEQTDIFGNLSQDDEEQCE